MVLLEKEAEKVALSTHKEGHQSGTSLNGLKSVTNRNGSREIPFTEGDVQEVYEDRYDFFKNELKLPDEQARKRAHESTEAWRREVFGMRQ